MGRINSAVEIVDQIISDAANKGIIHLSTLDYKLSGNILNLNNKKVVNFGSCSYLGLEFDERIINGAINEVRLYGSQFSSSRAYVSTRHYDELENLFTDIFGGYSIVAPTTTLGHIAAIPVLVNDNDAVILDHQVHNSVQTAASLLKPRGIHVELLRHNRMDLLEERIKVLKQKHEKIWYMADGVYSMFGDGAPLKEIEGFLNKYPEFNFYVDDAHGMSCFGKHGRGYVLSQMDLHKRMVFTTSLAKAFATGGAVLVFKDKELARKVKSCGGPFITSGPLQPATLGAAIASAKIHLSDEINELQNDLMENIKFTNLMLKKYNLPVVSESKSPVFFVAVSLPKMGYNMIKRLMDEGYYLNLGVFPAVPMKNTGIRFTITRLHTFEQIENMVCAMAKHFPLAMAEEGLTTEQIYRAFKLKTQEEQTIEKAVTQLINASNLHLNSYSSVSEINKRLWDDLLGERGIFNCEGLKTLEETFSGNADAENNWKFEYIIITDNNNVPVLATFLTIALTKEDMLSPDAISEQIEKVRLTEGKYHLTSKVISTGSPLSEGNHLYIDRTSPYWKEALILLTQRMSDIQHKEEIPSCIIRDFDEEDEELTTFFIDNGFFKLPMPENSHVTSSNWITTDEFLNTLTPSSKKHVKRYILKYEDKCEVNIVAGESLLNLPEEKIQKYYQLYLNVKNRSLEINTFTLPYKLFKNMCENNSWEIIEIYCKTQPDTIEKELMAVTFNYKTKTAYNFVLVGLDYNYQDEYKPYKQALYQVIKRARQLGLNTVRMGYTTTTEKRKLGAIAKNPIAYVQANDNYNMEVLGGMNAIKSKYV